MIRRGYLPDGRRTLTHRSIVRHLRRVLRAGDEQEAKRYASELAGYLGRLGQRHALDALETFRTAVAAVTLVLLIVLATPARAASPQEVNAADEAAGSAVFKEGRTLLEAGRYLEAAERFKAALALAPTVGTWLNLGDAYEKAGRTASAIGAFRAAGVLARKLNDSEREGEATRRSNLLEPRLSKVLLRVAPANRGGVAIQQDGRAIPEGAWDTALPVDPGEISLEATHPKKKRWGAKIHVEAKPGVITVDVPALEDAPEDAPQPGLVAATFWNGQRVAGVTIAGAGLVGIVVGSVFGAQTFSKNSASMPYCPTVPTMCYAPGVALRNDAYSAATASTIAFIAGGIGVAAGAVTFFTATKAAPGVGVGLAVGPRALAVEGSW